MATTKATEVKAWTYTNGYPHTLSQTTVHIPSTLPNTPSLLVEIAACALNPVDIQLMNQPKYNLPFPSSRNPKGCVCDFSGTVLAVPPSPSSSDSPQYKPGDQILGMTFTPMLTPYSGALSQQSLISLPTSIAIPKPPSWTHATAAAIPLVWLTAKAEIEAVTPWVEASMSKRVAVLGGSSATGAYCTMLAKRRGWKVVATSSGRNREFVVERLGADVHVDYTVEDVRTGVARFEPVAVIDCVGGTECLGLPSSRRYVTIVGDKTGRSSMGGPATYWDLWHPVNAVRQWVRWAVGRLGLGEVYDVVILEMRRDWLEEATSTLTPDDIFIDSTFAFDDAESAFERLATGRAKGKVVIEVKKE